jgi:hypothetical protein
MAVTTIVALALVAQASFSYPDVDLNGRLYKAVFTSGAGVLASGDLAALPEPLRARLSTFLVRRSSFKSTYRGQADSFETAAIDGKKRAVERAIVALVDGPGIDAAAAEFVRNAPIAYDWEGLPKGPLDEAAYAEGVLKNDPSSALAPFLYVFIAQRQRAAFEAADRQKDVETMKAAAKKYRAFVQRARGVEDPAFKLLADDLDRVPFVYVAADKHPRDFNPDS